MERVLFADFVGFKKEKVASNNEYLIILSIFILTYCKLLSKDKKINNKNLRIVFSKEVR